jgi:hypothetical protein
MKKILVFCIILLIGVLFYFLKYKNNTDIELVSENIVVETEIKTRQCYDYSHTATPDAPYIVTEHIDLNIDVKNITGVKRGTQSGPGMTNGYEGDLSGALDGNIATLVFDYIIEGSNNKEQEEYRITPTSLIKYRYPLKEGKGILVPDKTQEAREIVYSKIDCK